MNERPLTERLKDVTNDAIWRPAADEPSEHHLAASKPVFTRKEWDVLEAEVAKVFANKLPLTNKLLSLIPRPMRWSDCENKLVPGFSVQEMALPYIHKDVLIEKVKHADPRWPLDTVYLEAAAAKVAALQEQTVAGIGDVPQLKLEADCNIYGLLNFPGRLTYTPAESAREELLPTLLRLRLRLSECHHFGPYLPILGRAWNRVVDSDYWPEDGTKPQQTTRQRIAEIEDFVEGPLTVPALPLDDYRVMLLQVTPDVFRLIEMVKPTVVQWDDQTLKVVMSITSQPLSDHYGNCGLIVAEPKH